MLNRSKYCVANFKMNKTLAETKKYMNLFNSLLNENTFSKNITNRVVCPSYVCLNKDIFNSVSLGSQNINENDSGAFTGEISAKMLKEQDVDYVILGHSERREYFKESNSKINQKVHASLSNNLIPILCIGETLETRENNLIEDFILRQLTVSLGGISVNENIIIAYEPIWAIGTGKTATSKIVTEVNIMIRKILNDIGFDGENVSILYGGSVNRNNAKELISLNEVDGFLVGGASLDAKHFFDIYNFVEESV